MNWLEIIELRSVNKQNASVVPILRELTEVVDGKDNRLEIKIFHNSTVDTDWSIHLHYDTEQQENHGSRLGLQLVAALKELGLVHHSVWSSIVDYKNA